MVLTRHSWAFARIQESSRIPVMARSHSHFLRINPVEVRKRKASSSPLGATGFLLNVPALFIWTARATGVAAPSRGLTYFGLVLGLPAIALLLGQISLKENRRSDWGLLTVPLSLLLLGAAVAFHIFRAG